MGKRREKEEKQDRFSSSPRAYRRGHSPCTPLAWTRTSSRSCSRTRRRIRAQSSRPRPSAPGTHRRQSCCYQAVRSQRSYSRVGTPGAAWSSGGPRCRRHQLRAPPRCFNRSTLTSKSCSLRPVTNLGSTTSGPGCRPCRFRLQSKLECRELPRQERRCIALPRAGMTRISRFLFWKISNRLKPLQENKLPDCYVSLLRLARLRTHLL
mmetsp:Transcript_13105/g.32109  ORF Transcript_13105/g.32109 Transcript_13105/m.32109 type:complete len:208 (+) Transcript_13105:195-818(+)